METKFKIEYTVTFFNGSASSNCMNVLGISKVTREAVQKMAMRCVYDSVSLESDENGGIETIKLTIVKI